MIAIQNVFQELKTSQFLLLLLLLFFWGCGNDDILAGTNEEKPISFLEQLNGLDRVTALKAVSPITGYDLYKLTFQQLTDHNDITSPTFEQRVRILIKETDAPVVMQTLGYSMAGVERVKLDELTLYLNANVVEVEHRYFDDSIPVDVDWTTMTIDQAATDHHKIIEQLTKILPNKWIATGVSKGGMTASYLKRFYPDDIAGVIAFASPISLTMWDERFSEYSLSVVNADCANKYKVFQQQALQRIDELVPLLESWASDNSVTVSSFGYDASARLQADIALSWINSGSYYSDMLCEYLPLEDDDTAIYFEFLYQLSGFQFMTDEGLSWWLPYHMQSAMELGNFAVPLSHIETLLSFDVKDFKINMIGTPMPLFQPEVMEDIYQWAQFQATDMIFIYGEQDIFTGGAYPITTDESRRLQLHIEPGLHGIKIADLSVDAQQQIFSAVDSWISQ